MNNKENIDLHGILYFSTMNNYCKENKMFDIKDVLKLFQKKK